jgi:PAS domain S-box-containing protein
MLGALVQRSEDLSLVVRRDSTITYASDAIERMLGYHPSGVVGQRAADFVHPDDLEVFERALGLVLAGTLDRTPLLRVRHADGGWIRLEVTAATSSTSPRWPGSGQRAGGLRRYEASSSGAAGPLPGARAQRQRGDPHRGPGRDHHLRQPRHRGPLRALARRARGQRSGLVLLDDADHGVATSRFGALVGGARPLRLEHHMAHRDGTTRWVESTLTNLLDDPDVGGVVVNSRDVTESRVALRALEESEQRFRSLAASSPIGIVRIEPTGRLTYVNDRFRQIVGRTDPDDQPRYAAEVVHPADRDAAVAAWRAAVDAGEAFDRQVRVDRRDDEVCWVHIRTVPLRDEAGRITGHVGTVEDVTGRLELEARLAHQATHDPLTRLPNRTLLIDRLEVALARGAGRAPPWRCCSATWIGSRRQRRPRPLRGRRRPVPGVRRPARRGPTRRHRRPLRGRRVRRALRGPRGRRRRCRHRAPDPGVARGADPRGRDPRPGVLEHRPRPLPARGARCGRPHRPRRHRHVPGQGRGPVADRGLRRGDAGRRPGPGRRPRRAGVGDRPRRAGRRLPAGARPGEPPDVGRGGARPLAPPRPRPAGRLGVPRRGRGQRADPGTRPLDRPAGRHRAQRPARQLRALAATASVRRGCR